MAAKMPILLVCEDGEWMFDSNDFALLCECCSSVPLYGWTSPAEEVDKDVLLNFFYCGRCASSILRDIPDLTLKEC